ncbi:hypothetical protein ABFT23_01980 [Nocardioides sp. C4-1]|uniref:hypothetical protein n=1 Tax=Nocardioides sp. C4-1 TaxID=3151851 RepID=UPI0032673165
MDRYTLTARVAPAAMAAAPVLTLGLVMLPGLPGLSKLWSILSLGVTTYAAMAARRAGNRVQPRLRAKWGGMPTTVRLRYRGGTPEQEVTRRHREVERVIGARLTLPTLPEEVADPAAADAMYEAAMKRVLPKFRGSAGNRLLNAENRNYGFARNLLGLKPIGYLCSALAALVSAVIGAIVWTEDGRADALLWTPPIIVAVVAAVLWTQVDDDFVRPSADAYADRVLDAIAALPDPSAPNS